MSDRTVINERARILLRTLVEQYISDGEPVGSKRLLSASGLDVSAATVRNVMSELEELGYVESPHTSAGRVPTASGYRLFVDALIEVKPPRDDEVDRLRGQLDRLSDTRELVTTVSSLLSEISRMAGVVMLPRRERIVLRQVEFLPLSDKRVLVILVVNGSEVQNRIIHTERAYAPGELQQAANYLNAHYAGKDLGGIRRGLMQELRETREHMNQMMLNILQMADQALEAAQGGDDCIVEGQTNLMGYTEMADVDKLRRLFEAFRHKHSILTLLDHSIHADGVQIFIGKESGYDVLERCSVVAAPYRIEGSVVGVLGVIGPTRMAYDRMIPIVDVTAKLLGAALNSRR